MSEKEEVVRLYQITEQEYREWRHHPCTVLFRRYLRDYAGDLMEGHLARWKEGSDSSQLESECRVRVNLCEELEDLQFDFMVGFYKEREEE